MGRRHARDRGERIQRFELARSLRQLPQRSTEGRRALHADAHARHLVRADAHRSGRLHAAVEDQHAALSQAREERTADGLQVRRVRRRIDVRKMAQEAAEPIAMRNRFFFFAAAFALAAALVSAAFAQASAPEAQTAKSTSLPRTPDGHPDLTGIYDIATLTPVERPNGASPIYTEAEARKLEQQVAARKEYQGRAIDGNRAAPPKGGDGSAGAAGNVGGNNSFWIDSGSSYTIVDGQRRASIVIDPQDGRVPELTAEARQRATAFRNQAPTSDQTAQENDPGFEKTPGAYDDPERRPLGERCLIGFGSTSGPPALPNYFYNNLHQIVQTPDTVMILTEMVHDARIIRMNAQHLPKNIRLWMGDSVGHWEGDTLVVDTTNFTNKTRFRGSTENLHVIERFSRLDDKTLLYRFTIDDPATWTKPWAGEYSWPATNEKIYEYACHEGNYALPDILRGARLREKEAAAKVSKE